MLPALLKWFLLGFSFYLYFSPFFFFFLFYIIEFKFNLNMMWLAVLRRIKDLKSKAKYSGCRPAAYMCVILAKHFSRCPFSHL